MVLLTGCSSEAPETETSAEASPNTMACAEFADAVGGIPGELSRDDVPGATMWENVRVGFDEVALTAEGTVQDRMLAMVDDWPDLTDIMVWSDVDGINGKIEAVERACKADGITFDIPTLTAQ